jgi:glycosyltransferase involved in cell wall biosynthesis
MQEPLISVIIPTYNRGNTLREAVGSVLSQTYQNLELIVVDDCSKTPVVESLADIIDPRLRVIRHERNGGVSLARNTGAANAHGEFIAILDDDDTWERRKLSLQLEHMKKENCPASVTNFVLEGNQSLYSRKISREDPAWLIVTGTALGSGSSLLVQRDIFNEVGGFDPSLRRAQDWEWLLRYHEHGYSMAILPETMMTYRGDHRSSTKVVAESLSFIETRHRSAFQDGSYDRGAFDAAIAWKQARNELTEKHFASGAVKLAKVAVQHPIHFLHYIKVVLDEPVRHILSPRQPTKPTGTSSGPGVFISHKP